MQLLHRSRGDRHCCRCGAWLRRTDHAWSHPSIGLIVELLYSFRLIGSSSLKELRSALTAVLAFCYCGMPIISTVGVAEVNLCFYCTALTRIHTIHTVRAEGSLVRSDSGLELVQALLPGYLVLLSEPVRTSQARFVWICRPRRILLR